MPVGQKISRERRTATYDETKDNRTYQSTGTDGIRKRKYAFGRRNFSASYGEGLLKKIERLNSKAGEIQLTDIVTAITELRCDYKLAALLELAGIPRNTYYYHYKKIQSEDKYKIEKTEITAIYKENQGRYGYRRILMELRNRGYRSYRGNVGKIAPNPLNRDFHAEKPNQKWATDGTEFSLFGQKLYLSPILDMFNGEIISYAISEHTNLHRC